MSLGERTSSVPGGTNPRGEKQKQKTQRSHKTIIYICNTDNDYSAMNSMVTINRFFFQCLRSLPTKLTPSTKPVLQCLRACWLFVTQITRINIAPFRLTVDYWNDSVNFFPLNPSTCVYQLSVRVCLWLFSAIAQVSTTSRRDFYFTDIYSLWLCCVQIQLQPGTQLRMTLLINTLLSKTFFNN